MPEAAMNEPKQDFLEAMFHMQAELNRRIGVDTTALPEEEQPKWVLNYCRAMSQETAELIDSVPWKWWAKYQTYDKQNARIEVVDLFHFLISLAQVVGLSAQDVHDLYMKKNKLNFQRQDSGYSVKDSGDNKDLKV
jgi:dimeric dUTPase (all-alpha-NTP-PPase superfamily)